MLAQRKVVCSPTKRPYRIYKRQLRHFVPGTAQIPGLVLTFGKTKIQRRITNQQCIIGQSGDPALDFGLTEREHQTWDLGGAWYEMTKLPFVYAVWALRRGANNLALRQHLREARDFGLDTLDNIIQTRTEYTLDFRKDYLGWYIHYHLGSDEKQGLQKFIELLRKHGDRLVFEPRYVF